jgi:hypothetical protein
MSQHVTASQLATIAVTVSPHATNTARLSWGSSMRNGSTCPCVDCSGEEKVGALRGYHLGTCDELHALCDSNLALVGPAPGEYNAIAAHGGSVTVAAS